MATNYADDLLNVPSQPAQTDYASDVLGETPKSRTLTDYEITPGKSASFSTLSKAAMVDDPQTKLKIFAQDRFPDDPKAVDRYGIMDGEVIYTDGEKIYQETPTGYLGGAKDLAASLVGKSPTIGGAVLGGIAGAPGGPFTAIPMAIAGAMGGEGVRKTVANVALKEPQTSLGNFKSMAKEGAFAAMGEFAGAGLTGALERNLVRDIKRLDPNAMAVLETKSKSVGVDLFPAQVTNLRSMKGKHETLGRMDASADIVADASMRQAEQANAAAYRYFASISNKTGTGQTAKDAAQDILDKRVAARAARAAPFYQRAFDVPVETTPELAALISRPSMAQAVEKAKILAKEGGIDLADPLNTIKGLHYVKMAMDDIIDAAPETGSGKTFARSAKDTRAELIKFMDTASPDYAAARRVYAGSSKELEAVEDGLIGDIARREKRLDMGARELFSTNQDPAAIRFARREFEKQGKSAEWNSIVRSFLQDAFEQAGKFDDGITNQAPRFRKNMIGNPRQREILKNALSYDQYEALLDMADVFEAMGRVKGTGNSMTMPLQEGARALRNESGSGVIGNLLTPQRIPGRIVEWIQEARLGNHAEKMAEILTTPGDVRRLKEIKKLSPNDKKFIAGLSALLGVSASPSGAEEVPLQQPPRQ